LGLLAGMGDPTGMGGRRSSFMPVRDVPPTGIPEPSCPEPSSAGGTLEMMEIQQLRLELAEKQRQRAALEAAHAGRKTGFAQVAPQITPTWQQQLWHWPAEAGMAPPGEEARSAFSTLKVGQKIYCTGGFTDDGGAGKTPCTRVDVFDISKGCWELHPPMLDARSNHGIVTAGGRLYVAGGRGLHGALATCEVLDLASKTWHRMPSLPVPQPTARRAPDSQPEPP